MNKTQKNQNGQMNEPQHFLVYADDFHWLGEVISTRNENAEVY